MQRARRSVDVADVVDVLHLLCNGVTLAFLRTTEEEYAERHHAAASALMIVIDAVKALQDVGVECGTDEERLNQFRDLLKASTAKVRDFTCGKG